MSREGTARNESFLGLTPKWSWAIPFDESGPNPTSYEPRSSFDGIPISPSFGKQVKSSALLNDEYSDLLQSKFTPSGADYSPNKTAVMPHKGNTKVGTGPARKHDFMDTYNDRSPGPKYELPNQIAKASKTLGKFGNSKARSHSTGCNEVSYLGIQFTGSKAATFKGKTGIEKVYNFNDITRKLGVEGPGPGKYNGRKSCDFGYRWSHAERLPDPRKRSPGPAAYKTEITKKASPQTFGSSGRNFDPRGYHRPLDFHRY